MIAISLAALVAITWLLLPKNSEKMKPIQIGLSVAILLGWITLPRLLASFWLNPFLGINFGPTDSVFQDEMQETGIILLGGLWMLIATVIFPLMQLGTALWQRLFKMSPSGSNPPSKQPTLCL